MKDYRKRELVPGTRVAYNRSGEVRLGTLESCTPRVDPRRPHLNGRGSTMATILVRGDDGKVSKLARTTNLVAIDIIG